MTTLQRAIEQAEQSIRKVTPDEAGQVDRALQQLSREQTVFIQKTLENARVTNRSPAEHINLLELLLEKWWAHSLATKLAIVNRVVCLSDPKAWPVYTQEDRLVARIVAAEEMCATDKQGLTIVD